MAEGIIGRYGTLDPTDGGDTGRFSLSGRWSQSGAGGITRASAYVIRYQMNLWNNFTYFLNDPVNGDQFRQRDARVLGGGEISRVFQGDLFGLPMENEIGVQTRTDDIRVGLFNTTAGSTARRCSTTECWKRAPPSTTRTGCAGPTGCAPASASGPTGTTPMSAPTPRQIRAGLATASSTRSSGWCSGRGRIRRFT